MTWVEWTWLAVNFAIATVIAIGAVILALVVVILLVDLLRMFW